MGHIYQIVNSVNVKVYVGQTVGIVNTRWIKHCSEAKRYQRGQEDREKRNKRGTCSKLYAAINKHGVDNFRIETIETLDDDDLDSAEMAYIEELDSVKNGYNLKYGGNSSKHAEETIAVISKQTKIGIAANIENFRKHDEILAGLPQYCAYIKAENSIAITKHPKCKWKSFSVFRYGSIDKAKEELLKYYQTL